MAVYTPPVAVMDAAEIQAIIHHHASSIAAAIEDGGIKPSKRDELERTCLRMLQLAKALSQCELERRDRQAEMHRAMKPGTSAVFDYEPGPLT